MKETTITCDFCKETIKDGNWGYRCSLHYEALLSACGYVDPCVQWTLGRVDDMCDECHKRLEEYNKRWLKKRSKQQGEKQ